MYVFMREGVDMGEQKEEKQGRRPICVGLLAHVDAGKTTLSEGMLYQSGQLKKLGRVDHKDAFLDTEEQERQRGITIFSKQAVFQMGDRPVTLLDTPGHVDFSSEMERVLSVLDYAVLVISGTDGVQSHTRTLWRLLSRYHIPTFLFINKMDLPGTHRQSLMEQLRRQLDGGCVNFDPHRPPEELWEEAALCDEDTMAAYLEEGRLEPEDLSSLIAQRKLFPCYFGSALRLQGVTELLEGLERYATPRTYGQEFAARVYKIGRDPQGARLTYLKVTGGTLRVKALLSGKGRAGEEPWEEKVDQIRIYSGARYQAVDQAPAGTVCAVTGLSRTWAGEGLGAEAGSPLPVLEPVLTYQVILPPDKDPHTALSQLRQLEEEDPQLHLVWNEQLRQIHIQLMGQVQLEILQKVIAQRFSMEVSFGQGNIVYKETIANKVEGVGHYEPLRHYAEVHLILEPGERGSGLVFDVQCPEEVLERSWQRLVLSHLEEKTHLGVLTGSPITDMKITLVGGRAHEKHTEGGDFRQATYRAVRQGLMQAESVLLEPWYDLRLELPPTAVGRAMADIQRMGGVVSPPESQGKEAVLTGRAPVSALGDYAAQVTAYTKGQGRLSLALGGYAPCHDQQQVVEQMGYDPQRDLENSPDSVFCAHGAGFAVEWDQVPEYMHLPSFLEKKREEVVEAAPAAPAVSRYTGSLEEDKELMAIYERTYGPIRRRDFESRAKKAPEKPAQQPEEEKPAVRQTLSGPGLARREEYLLVDGYNIIFAWDELKTIAQKSMDTARQILMDILSNYQGYRGNHVILVFDAYKVPGNLGSVSRYHNIHVVYTKEAETADSYIEKTTYSIARHHKVQVATSDNLEQVIILGHGALRISAAELRAQVGQVKQQIDQILEESRRGKNQALGHALEKAREK